MSQSSTMVYPRGWFVVSFSDEIPVGGTKQLRYFGQQMVAFRGEDGVVRILDAYCAHMGADLGAGGVVRGNNIECPFHAWRFCGTGECVEIPYAIKIPPRAKQKAWPVREVNGVILMYFDPAGQAPQYEIPVIPEYGTEEWLPWTRDMYTVKTHPREIVDNLADKAHFPRVHNTHIAEFNFEVNGHTATQTVTGKSLLADGGVDNFSSISTYHGPGYLLMRMNGIFQNYMLIAHTPIEPNLLHLRLGVSLRVSGSKQKTDMLVGRYMSNLKSGFEDDLRIWENKIYKDPPLICDGDGPIGHLRRWYKQFYVQPATEQPTASA